MKDVLRGGFAPTSRLVRLTEHAGGPRDKRLNRSPVIRIGRGSTLAAMAKIPITGNEGADKLLEESPLALLLGMLLDQHMQKRRPEEPGL
jgi:hypothetical protein